MVKTESLSPEWIDLKSLTLIKLLEDKGYPLLIKYGLPKKDLHMVNVWLSSRFDKVYSQIGMEKDGFKYVLLIHKSNVWIFAKGFNTEKEFKTACKLLAQKIGVTNEHN